MILPSPPRLAVALTLLAGPALAGPVTGAATPAEALAAYSGAVPAEPAIEKVVANWYANAPEPVTTGFQQSAARWNPSAPQPRGPRWRQGQMVLQGWLGFTDYSNVSSTGGNNGDTTGESIQNMPVIGGGAQWKVNGEGSAIDFGPEAMINFSGRANGSAFYFGSGGSAVAVSIDMLLIELMGGLTASKFVGEKMRVYGSGGVLMQWVNYNQDGDQNGSGSGFGTGWYGRFGLEWVAAPGAMVGIAARYSESSIGLGSDVGTLDLDGWQYMFTVTRGF